MGLYRDCLEYLKESGLVFVDRFIPYFLCSFGCHIFNIRNRQFDEEETPLAIYWINRRIPDMRLPLMMIAPPVFSKSTFLKHLLEGLGGIFATVVETFFKSYVTEAHLVGSVSTSKNQQKIETIGFLEKHPNCIVGVEEFSTVMMAGKQEHSMGLDGVLLDWFSGSDIRKGLKAGDIGFKTNATLWAGTQLGRERIELRGGMFRRIFFVLFIPTEQDIDTLRDAMIDATSLPIDFNELGKLRIRLKNLIERVDCLDGIYFTNELKDYFRKKLDPSEIPLFRKLAVGYAIMQEEFDTVLEVGIDDELRRLMNTAVRWRRRISREISDETGLGTDMVLQVLKLNGGKMKCSELQEKLLLFEVSFGESDRYLKSLRNQKRIIIYQDKEMNEVWVRLIE